MSTYMPKANEVNRKWYVLDATDKPLGRVAAQAAHILRGKHKPTYAPHVVEITLLSSIVKRLFLQVRSLKTRSSTGTQAGSAD